MRCFIRVQIRSIGLRSGELDAQSIPETPCFPLSRLVCGRRITFSVGRQIKALLAKSIPPLSKGVGAGFVWCRRLQTRKLVSVWAYIKAHTMIGLVSDEFFVCLGGAFCTDPAPILHQHLSESRSSAGNFIIGERYRAKAVCRLPGLRPSARGT